MAMGLHLSCRIRWAIAFVLTGVAVTVSYYWLDRPIAYFSHAELRNAWWFARMTVIPEFFVPLAVLVLVVLGFRALAEQALSRFEKVILLCAISLVFANAAKKQLKIVFGRTWPETWTHHNPSLIDNGVYGFHPFHVGAAFESFPSGHTSAVCAVTSVLWMCYPKFRVLYAGVIAVVIIGLVGADFHFLSDCIAGAFVGSWIGWAVVVLWDRGKAGRSIEPSARGSALNVGDT